MGLFFSVANAQVPANDDCNNAININIPASGFGLGVFTPAETDLTNATIQAGENFAPALLVAGLDKKSVWYKFSISTIREVRITLGQSGSAITSGDAGFTVYSNNNCPPTTSSISDKLTPIATFGNTYHPCVPAGDYFIQVSSKLAANGPVSINVEIRDQTGAFYDHPNGAYNFGIAGLYSHKIDFNTECHSIEDAAEICPSLFNYQEYQKTAWFTFTTPAYFDYLIMSLSGTGTPLYFGGNDDSTLKTFGYTLYQGNTAITPFNTLTIIDGCDSLQTNGYTAAVKKYTCSNLQPNTTYSVQLFFHKDFINNVRLGILTGGSTPATAPLPLTGNAINLGALPVSPAGSRTISFGNFGCESRHTTPSCSPAMPAGGVVYKGSAYNLSSFVTFTLNSAAAITFRPTMLNCGTYPVIRLFRQSLTANCSGLDLANLVGTAGYDEKIDCLSAGDYVVQVLGRDTASQFVNYIFSTPLYNNEQCLFTNLGSRYQLSITAYSRLARNNFSLNTTGAVDNINIIAGLQSPLVDGVPYPSSMDTMGCEPTLRPWDTTCSPLNDKVMYRQFIIADSGTVDYSNLAYPIAPQTQPQFSYRLYSGDAAALASAQNIFNFPDKVTGIVPNTLCLNGFVTCANKTTCVLPGVYTFTTMGSGADVGWVDQPTFTFVKTRTKHNSPFTAQDLGSLIDTLGPTGGTKKTDVDIWSCDDNAVSINGFDPCPVNGSPATKAIYRQFYLKEPSVVRITNTFYPTCKNMAYASKTLFAGKATDGLNTLSFLGNPWGCFANAQTQDNCSPLPAGWYTVVSYGTGPNYDNTTRLTNAGSFYNGYITYNEEYNITISPACPAPKYNRPYKASVNSSGQPHLLQMVTQVISTPAYPKTDTLYNLPTEYFNCTVDTPFTSHPVNGCEPASNRVAYYIFKTTEVCFLQIDVGNLYAAIFDKDVRIDSLQFPSSTPIQPCINRQGMMQFCFFQPGTYTLVIFAKDANSCSTTTPRFHIEKTAYARFDYAANAYDFGPVVPDSIFHNGRLNDVNPLEPSRAPSNDFFYCTTGASITDPGEAVCNATFNPNIYNSGPNKPVYDDVVVASNNIPRRNLWYTFVANDAGFVKVKVEAKTLEKTLQPKFAVYRSDVDATLPFTTVVANGLVDSTIAQGLTYIGTNELVYPFHCYNASNEISFYRDPCTSIPNRYYVLVENVNGAPLESGGILPNAQVEVSVLIDSSNLVIPKFDHFYQAGNIATPTAGVYIGQTDNYSCASRDIKDPVYNTLIGCQKTIWYKFTSTITGIIRYRIKVNNKTNFTYDSVQLFKETIPGDSTATSLKIQLYSAVSTATGKWAETCLGTGTYYLLLPGCNMLDEYVTPEIELIEQEGDFCSKAVPTFINGTGISTASVLVNCHTIGTDYGEFGEKLTCPPNASTAFYKSSWFRIDIGGADTLDVTAYLAENTNAASGDIKYRLMTGDCGAMQEQSCVLDALTQNTYQCLVPGQSYYVQVFTPIVNNNVPVTGDITLNLSSVKHSGNCIALSNCLSNANFDTSFNCNTGNAVTFENYSTYGFNINYQWNFGYNGETSTNISPQFAYPALPNDEAYTIKLIVTNTACGKKDSLEKTILIPARPYANLGADIAQCSSTNAVILRATTHAGATYLWQDNSIADTLRVISTGNNLYTVKVNYNGCSSSDTVRVMISPIRSRALRKITLCSGTAQLDVRRGFGETYQWNTGAVTSAIDVTAAGFYWADITYFDCIYRDSFEVKNIDALPPFGDDIKVCLANGGYRLGAVTNGALSYTWQDGSTADSILVTVPGEYSVTINFGNCTIKDTINILGYPAPVVERIDTSICEGQILLLPLGSPLTIAGNYKDTLKYNGGCDSLIRIIHLSVNAKPDIGNDIPISICRGSSINLTDYFTATAFAKVWSFNNAPVANLASVNTAGNYQLIAGSANACSDTAFVVLTVNNNPTIGADSAINICEGNIINLYNIFDTTGLTSDWTKNNISVINPAAVTTFGTYKLIAKNSHGCSDTAEVNLSISTKPTLVITTPATVCIPQTKDLTIPAITAGSSLNLLFTYWQDSAATILYNSAATATAGTYYIKAANTTGCFDIKPVTVSSYPVQIVDAGNDKGICDSDSTTTISVLVSNITAPVSYQWEPVSIGGIANPTSFSTVVKPSITPQHYIITVKDGYGCNYLVSDSVTIMKQLPVPAFAGNDTIAVTGLPHQLTATGGISFVWSPENLLNNPYLANPLATIYADSTLFTVTVTDNQGCKGYDSIWVKTLNGITYYVPNAFSPNGDMYNQTFKPIPAGIESTEMFRVFNRYGQVVFETTQYMKGWDGTYKGKPQPVGNYVWVLKGKGRNGKTIEMKGNVLLVR